ncbi:MAG: DNA translocase FtsK 4TM domain-containing protein, partial [Bacteroidales bacterium]|nr:DNA translocase FtsK 4TM domain-containing protein [Bacteroidales bacterium]
MGRKKLEYESPVDKLVRFFKDERTKFVIGLGLMLLTVIALLGFVSYLFTWKEDQSKFEIGIFRFLFNSDIEVANSGSKIGALLAHIFIHNLFGLPAFAFLLLFAITALKVFKFEPMPYWPTVKHSLIWMVWLSVFLSMIFGNDYFFIGGVFGYEVDRWFESVIGKFGTALFLLICAGAIVMMTVENSVSWVKIFGDDLRRHRDLKNAWQTANTFAKSMTETQKLNAEKQQGNTSTRTRTKKDDDDNYDEVIFEEDNRGDDNSLNSPINTPKPEGGSKGIGSFVRDIFSGGKDYVGKDQKIDFNDRQQQSQQAQPQQTANVRQPESTESNGPNSVKERYVIGGTNTADNTDGIDFEVEDNTEEEQQPEVTFAAPDPDVQPSEVTPGTSTFTATAASSDGEAMPLEVEKNHDITVTDISNLPPYDPTLDLSDYKLPPVSLLNHLDNKKTVSDAELTENKTKIVNVLKDFRIKLTKIKANIGPTVTLYELTPAPGVKISKIKSLE